MARALAIVINLLAGSLVGAWIGADLATRLATTTLYRVIAVLLVLIALVLATLRLLTVLTLSAAAGRAIERVVSIRRGVDPAAVRGAHRGVEPVELLALLGDVRAEEHRVEADHAPTLDVARPVVAAEVTPPALDAIGVGGLVRVQRLAHVVVPGHRASQPAWYLTPGTPTSVGACHRPDSA